MRGKVSGTFVTVDTNRITPACAGKRLSMSFLMPSYSDHPRVCGEKYQAINAHRSSDGSPPRVRGKVALPIAIKDRDGITPACAGKRHPHPRRCPTGWDHPRVCGEKVGKIVADALKKGSPPRVRGKAVPPPCCATSCRITPACAGKRVEEMRRIWSDGDHPRVCGEKHATQHFFPRLGGSPPRVRGKD